MMKVRDVLNRITVTDWLALALLLLYVVVFATLTINQHMSFNTNALDLGKFDQAIWNTANGRFFAVTLAEDSVIASHFSPTLALYAPLYWIWPDVRILFVAQSLLLGGAGFLLYLFFRRTNPWLGLVVFAAYLMHPALHQVNLVEFRRSTLAVFATSFALLHLLRRNYGWMALGLALAMLSKEDMSLTAVVFGLYILLVQRSYLIGLLTAAVGLAWFVLVPFAILPSLLAAPEEGYVHAGSYYSYLGGTLPEILNTVVTKPAVILEHMLRPIRLRAVFNFFWPAAFLFLLAPEIAFFMLPHLGFLLASEYNVMGRLEAWYPAMLVILLYWAAAVGLSRLRGRWQKIGMVLLLAASFAGWMTQSRLWPGPHYDPTRYQVTGHHRQVETVLQSLPAAAIVMAQDPLVPHLSHRENIYIFPWTRRGNQPDFVVLDREMRPYPYSADEYRTRFYEILAGDTYEIAQQAGSLYVFEYVETAVPAVAVNETWGDSFTLQGYSIAAALPDEIYTADLEELPAGSTLRVALNWQVTAEMGQNYTVFVHAVTPDGRVVAQHDSWPADTHRPTSVLPAGEKVRDVHYLTLMEAASLDDLSFRVGLYEATTGEKLMLEGERPFLLLPGE
ncbi:MAG: DUF2079 domain-containing protein [Anaerolineales bacterium]|nr:DUF2079 domain-containing protein [Anaerolineales bacterium]